MKKLLAIVLAAFAMSAFSAEPAKAPAEKPKQEMKLAKKKKDKDAEAKAKAGNKSPKKAETSKK